MQRASDALLLLTALGALSSCGAPREHTPEVTEFLARATDADEEDRSLTGVWTDGNGESVLVAHNGSILGVLPLGANLRAACHFGEGTVEGEKVSLLTYRQGVSSDTSAGGLDVPGVREATLRRAEQVLAWTDGTSWTRAAPVPGTGRLTGLWGSPGGRLAIAHEGEFVTASALDPELRKSWTVAYSKIGEDGRLWTIKVRGGRVVKRTVGRPSEEGTAIEWSGGSTWHLEELLVGAPPAAPKPLAPAKGSTLPNAVDGKLRWEFDWSDVPGATEYRLEVSQEDAPRAFVEQAGLENSEYVHEVMGGFLSRTEDWSWRVAASVNGKWTDWSKRIRFSIEED